MLTQPCSQAIWLHPQDASGVIWLCKYPSNRAGWQRASPFPLNQIPGTQVASANVQFGRLNVPYGRYDFIQTDPSNGAWSVWRNDCNKLAQGADDGPTASNAAPGPGPGSASSGAAVCGDPEPTTFPPGYTPGGTVAVIAGSTESLSPTNSPAVANPADPGAAEVLTIGGSTYTGNSESGFVVDGQTLAPGRQITVSGTTVSLDAGGSFAVVGGSTENLGATITGAGNAEPTIVFGGSTYSANSATQFVIDGQTLTPNGQITISGTPISLELGASTAVVGGVTTPVFPGVHGWSLTAPPSSTTSSSSSSGGGNGDNQSGDGYGITLSVLVTIASASKISGFDVDGGSNAWNALKPAARHGLDLFGEGLNALQGLSHSHGIGADDFPSDEILRPCANLLSQAAEDFGSVSEALDSIELTDFSAPDKPVIQDIITPYSRLVRGFCWRFERVVDSSSNIWSCSWYIRRGLLCPSVHGSHQLSAQISTKQRTGDEQRKPDAVFSVYRHRLLGFLSVR